MESDPDPADAPDFGPRRNSSPSPLSTTAKRKPFLKLQHSIVEDHIYPPMTTTTTTVTDAATQPPPTTKPVLPRFPKKPDSLIRHDEEDQRQRQLEEYLQATLKSETYRNHHELVICNIQFSLITTLMQLSIELGCLKNISTVLIFSDVLNISE